MNAAPLPADEDLPTATPRDVGLRPEALANVISSAEADPHRDLSHLLVARNGRLVLEEYFNGADRDTLRDVRSLAKSITGTLVGIALHEGAITHLDAPLNSFFPIASEATGAERNAGSDKAGLTLRHLLEMRSGLDADDWSGRPDGTGASARGPQPFYFASGNGGQRLFVVPGEHLVMVVLSTAYGRGYAHRRAHDILRGVLAAVGDGETQRGP